MTLISQKLTPEKDGISGYLAYPKRKQRGPAILWIHHNHGVTDNLKQEAYEYAEMGYTAFVPNLYHLLGHPGSHHLGQGQDIQKITGDDKFIEVIKTGWDYLAAREDVDPQRIGVIGYCMGGRLGIPFLSTYPQARAFVAFYPSIKDELETEIRPRHAFTVAREIRCPTMVVFGGKDHISTNEVQLKLWQSFIASGQPLEWHYYSWGLHGFIAPVSEGYQPQLARRVRPLAVDFLDRHLKSGD